MQMTLRIFSATVFVSAATPALAQQNPDLLGNLATELGKFAIIVVVLESGLSAIFNWRVYRAVFNHRALKMPVTLFFGLLIVWLFNYDLFGIMISQASGHQVPENFLTKIISALIIAGGSAGIHTLFQNLGLRSVLPEGGAKPKLHEGEAWVSVRVNGAEPGESYHISIRDMDGEDVIEELARRNNPAPKPTPAPVPAGETAAQRKEREKKDSEREREWQEAESKRLKVKDLPMLAGSVEDKSFRQRLREAWESDSMRFPNYGGHTVRSGQDYEIRVLSTDLDVEGNPRTNIAVFQGSFAPRSIIDFNVTV